MNEHVSTGWTVHTPTFEENDIVSIRHTVTNKTLLLFLHHREDFFQTVILHLDSWICKTMASIGCCRVPLSWLLFLPYFVWYPTCIPQPILPPTLQLWSSILQPPTVSIFFVQQVLPLFLQKCHVWLCQVLCWHCWHCQFGPFGWWRPMKGGM